jgi:hypothetical protein
VESTARELKEQGRIAQELEHLREHRSWAVLRELYEERKAKQMNSLVGRLLARPHVEAYQRDIDYTAGFWAGAEWILKSPDLAQSELDNMLARERSPR